MNFIESAFSQVENLEGKIEFALKKEKDKDGKIREETIDLLNTDFERFQRLSHEKINYSLLSGEYINCQNFKESLQTLKTKYSELLNYVVFVEELQNITYQIVECLDKTIDYYLLFYSDISNKYSLNQNDYLFSINSVVNSVIRNEKLSKGSLKYFKYFHVNILTAKCDHLLSHKDSLLVQLYNIEKALNDIKISGFESLSEIVLDKCNFLKSKWFIRKQEEAPDELIFIVDGKEHQIENREYHSLFEKWIKYSKEHYQLEINWKPKIENQVREFHNKEFKDLSFLQIHRKIKYHKDALKDYEGLKDISNFLMDTFNLQKKNNCNYFNEFAFCVMSNYAINNSFSLFVEENSDLYNLKEEYIRVKLQTHRYLNNFFIEYKFLNSAIEILNHKLETGDNQEFLKEYEDYIHSELKTIFNKYEFNHKWSIKNYNYIFQLPFEECKLKIESAELDFIFIASSFVLPPSIKKFEEQFNLIKSKFDNLLFHIESIKILKTDTDKINNLNNEIILQKDIIKDREIKSIEILGIFTALIAFVFGSISTIEFLKTTREVLMFNVALALSLISFVCVLIIFIRGKDTLRRNWMWLVGLLGLFILFWGSLWCLEMNPTTTKERDRLSKKIDSIIVNRLNKSNSESSKGNFSITKTPVVQNSNKDSTIVEPASPVVK